MTRCRCETFAEVSQHEKPTVYSTHSSKNLFDFFLQYLFFYQKNYPFEDFSMGIPLPDQGMGQKHAR
ncbi:MAG: hypothetical protein A3I59_02785 [Planctomycetes bacterium RIFCSPLOWO2_02_FULL_50_16]|nr:MAG: hypothetical protein A3I59_02785 [Planctomycetes bacterium RIFCSPLOWO2_02_FULL_50_16]